MAALSREGEPVMRAVGLNGIPDADQKCFNNRGESCLGCKIVDPKTVPDDVKPLLVKVGEITVQRPSLADETVELSPSGSPIGRCLTPNNYGYQRTCNKHRVAHHSE